MIRVSQGKKKGFTATGLARRRFIKEFCLSSAKRWIKMSYPLLDFLIELCSLK